MNQEGGRKKQWPVSLNCSWMPNWASSKHRRRVAREKEKTETKVVTKGRKGNAPPTGGQGREEKGDQY